MYLWRDEVQDYHRGFLLIVVYFHGIVTTISFYIYCLNYRI